MIKCVFDIDQGIRPQKVDESVIIHKPIHNQVISDQIQGPYYKSLTKVKPWNSAGKISGLSVTEV